MNSPNNPCTCPNCRAEVLAEDAFCPACGAALPAPTPPPPTEPLPAASGPRAPPTQTYPGAYQPPPPGYPPAPAGYGAPPGDDGGRRGLTVALIIAAVVVVLGAGAGALLALSGSKDHPDIIAATAATPTTPAATRAATPEQPTTTEEPKEKPRPPSQRALAARMLTRHWANRRDGRYEAAYRDLDPVQQARTSLARWISDHQADGLYRVSDQFTVTLTGPDTATATIVRLHTEAHATGCKNWSGYYLLSRIDGRWRVGKAKISAVTC